MADSKITALTALTAADPINDMLPIVDVSDTTMAASGTTKKISVNNILGASGTATLASATITGALTVDTTTLVVDAANDMVGVGTAPIYKFHAVATSGAIGAFRASTAAIARLLVGNTVGDLEIKVNANSDGQITSDAGKYLGLGSNTSNDRVILDTSGNLSITNGNLVMATSGKGIDFAATANSSGTMTSELLNDYEEGTWTPVVADASTGGNVGTCTINSATYTKIGRQVSIQCDLRSITTTGMTGGNNLFIRGLPFASVKGGNGSFYTYRVGRNASTVSSAVTVEHGVSHAFLSLFTTSSANTNLSILVSDITSGTSELALSVTYTV